MIYTVVELVETTIFFLTMKKLRIEFHFYGKVQGVGFRYTAKYTAAALGVTGWVMNEWDGSVTMQAQGTKEQLDEMISRLENAMFIQIDRIEKTELAIDEMEHSFRVE